MDDELAHGLTPDETKETNEIISLYKRIDGAQIQLSVQKFPQIVRSVVEYLQSAECSAAERRFLTNTLSEGLRKMRRILAHDGDEKGGNLS